MKAKLILKVRDCDEGSLIEPDGYLNLYLSLPKLEFDLLSNKFPVWDDNVEEYKNRIEEVIIDYVEQIKYAIPSITLTIDESITNFMPLESVEISKFISRLTVSI